MEKFDVCINKNINAQPLQNTTFRQKEIFELLKKYIFKVDILEKVVNSEDILSNIQVFDFNFVDKKNLGIDKTYEKSHLIVQVYKDKHKNFVLIYLPKIQ